MALEPGYYCVDDPDVPDQATYWEVGHDGVTRDYPAGARWRPLPPRFPNVDRETRTDLRNQWYQRDYYPWRRAITVAIEADPQAAQLRFYEAWPHPEEIPAARRARQPRVRTRPSRATRSPREILAEDAATEAQALIVAALHADGHSYVNIARDLGLTETTARRRGAYGQGLISVETAKKSTADLFVAALTKLVDVNSRYGRSDDDAVNSVIRSIIKRRTGENPPTVEVTSTAEISALDP
jgi:hypothetical protein